MVFRRQRRSLKSFKHENDATHVWHYNSLKAEEYDEGYHQGGEAQEITAGIYDGRQFDVG